MADYDISNVPRRVVYAASGTGPYAFTFEVLSSSDIAVYKGDQLLTLTTDYTVSIASNGTGSVTLVSSAGTSNITIVGAKTIARTTDFTTGGDFFANTLNDELDAQTIFIQQVAETAERGLKAPVTDPTDINMTLPSRTSRAGKTLAFDATGNPAVGEDIGNWRGDWAAGTSYTVRDLVRDASNLNIYRCKTAHTSSGSAPINTNTDSGKWDVVIAITDISDLSDAAAASASAAASSASSASSSASSASTSASTATTKASEASTSATNAASSASSASSSASSASTSATTATTKASEASSSATSAASSASTASTKAGEASSSASSASTSASTASTKASEASTSATNAATSATNAANSASSASTSASTATTQAALATTKAAAADASAVSAAASAASAAASYDSFDDRYLGAKSSAPSVDNDGNALLAGALYYNTTTGKMNVFDGGVWIEASAASQAILTVYKFTATAGQTTFSGTDDASLTLGYTVGSAIFTLNGVVLEVGSEVTATTGTSAVLATAASAGDEFNVYAFATFNLANVYTKAETDAKYVELAGDTMTGNLNLPGVNIINATNPTGWISVDSGLTTKSMYSQFNTSDNIGITGTYTNHPYALYTNNIERMRINSAGEILFGLTAPNAGALVTAKVTTSKNLYEAFSTASGMTHYLVNTSLSSAGGSDALGVYDASGISARISTNGYFQSRPNSYGGTSDIKLKENIVDATPKLTDILNVRIRNFNFKDDPDVKQIGVVAQELESVFPSLVYETPDCNSKGENLGTTTKSVKYSVFVPMLIKAIQELNAKVDAQAAEIQALKGAK